MLKEKIGKNCTGCTACYNSCTHSAITMEYDEEGFLYPRIDKEKCVGCGICEKKCPILKDNNSKYLSPIVYAGWNIDEQVRINSTSGGVFSALAEEILKRKGVVVGAYYDENFTVKHGVIEKIEDIHTLRQSKYTQSKLENIFKEVKKKLDDEQLVLFCGTPCQSAGLQSYLKRNYDRLFCCDFICRGVISPKVYRKFLCDMAEKQGDEIKKIQFKNKDYGWNQFSTKLTFKNGTIYQKDRYEDYYMRGYLKHNLYLRPSCHKCEFKKIPRVSDLSLGDFWGIGNYGKHLDNDCGTSVILVNSEKGVKLLDMIKNRLYLEQRELNEVLKGNVCLLNSAEEGKQRSYFFENISRYKFDELIEKIDAKESKISFREQVFQKLSIIKKKILRY